MKPAVYTTSCNDIHSNLAAEAFLMENSGADDYILYLWRNMPTVVIGRYQNPFIECDLEKMEKDGVKLSRRFSGGGAVYHDLGNLCFTFISPKESYDKDRNFRIVISALNALGVEACTSGRNDILADGFKISGNAFQIKAGKACHHGTLLVDCDMTRLPLYLTPDATKLEAHGVRSVASRVRNIREIRPDITIGALEERLIRSFSEECGQTCPAVRLDETTLLAEPFFRETQATLSSREWNFGMTPRFRDLLKGRNCYGNFSFQLDVDHAVIKGAHVFSDALDTAGMEELPGALSGLPYDSTAIEAEAGKKDPFIREALVLLASLVRADQNSK